MRAEANVGLEEGRRLLRVDDADPKTADAAASWTALKPCCCCSVPRWSRLPLGLLIFYLVAGVVVYVLGHFLVYPGSSNTKVGEACEELTVPLATGGSLPAIRCSWGNASTNCVPVVVFGGNAMNMYDSATHMRRVFPEDVCWNVYSMSLPGFQYAPRGGWTTIGQSVSDAKALLAFVSETYGRKSAVFGWSLGSSLAAAVSAESPEYVQCALLGAPFTSMRRMALVFSKNLVWPWLYLFDRWPTFDWVSQIEAPTVIFSPLRDGTIPAAHHKEVHGAGDNATTYWLQKNTSHMDFIGFKKRAAVLIRQLCV